MKKLEISILTGFLMASFFSFGQQAKDTLQISIGNEKKVILIGDNLNDFEKVKIDSIVQIVRKQMGGEFANASSSQLVETFVLDSIADTVEHKKKTREKADHSYIKGNYTIGISFMHGIFTPSLTSKLWFIPKSKIWYFVDLEGAFFFPKNESGNYDVKVVLFLNVGISLPVFYEKEFLKRTDFGLGSLLCQDDNFFKRYTFKIFTRTRIPKTPISISPELYIEGAFKTAYPGLSVNVIF